ncbi:hypothetical protein N7516_004370 [Penicillium verrucosum]|uniref:uncharacterized protein n=1 Tax=Penicillium verrucosum TaxID=60171 RepID=UPI002545A919|nr:uncharacterized protein N7516_004370 [Penicillium verrucosum]KAJ5944202.1 hypothetical protein N7516_004370 [Penicillium verrucosum]
MKFTGFTVSLALAGLSYSAAIPVLGNAEDTVSGIEGAVGGVTGPAANIAAPITSTAGGLNGAIKRDGTAALGETVETIPSLANGAVGIAGSAVGTVENTVSGVGPAGKRQLNNDLIGSTLGSAVPAIIQQAKAGGLPGAAKRDGTDALGETVETVPNLANSAVGITGSAVGTGESLVSGAAGTAENAVSGSAGKRQLNNDLIGSTLGSAVPAIIQQAKAGSLPGAKRDGTAALGETVETVPSLANSAVGIAGSAVGTGESLVSGAAGTAENAVSGSAGKRQLNNDLIGSTLGSAVPAIIQQAKAGSLPGAAKRDAPAALGETVEAIPNLANGAVTTAGSAVGTAENAVGHA